jgi:hypothetical protein
VDGDLAINSMMWQNAGKSGLDQWNFTLQPTSKSQVMHDVQALLSPALGNPGFVALLFAVHYYLCLTTHNIK